MITKGGKPPAKLQLHVNIFKCIFKGFLKENPIQHVLVPISQTIEMLYGVTRPAEFC